MKDNTIEICFKWNGKQYGAYTELQQKDSWSVIRDMFRAIIFELKRLENNIPDGVDFIMDKRFYKGKFIDSEVISLKISDCPPLNKAEK